MFNTLSKRPTIILYSVVFNTPAKQPSYILYSVAFYLVTLELVDELLLINFIQQDVHICLDVVYVHNVFVCACVYNKNDDFIPDSYVQKWGLTIMMILPKTVMLNNEEIKLDLLCSSM